LVPYRPGRRRPQGRAALPEARGPGRIYNLLRRRPDGTDDNPLFSYLQGAARLYMSLFDVSQAEFEAVFNRLTRSAKGYMEDAASTNYIRFLHAQMHQH